MLVRTGALAFSALLALGVGQEAGRFVIDGSTGVMPLAAALVEAYQERNPGITIEMGPGLGPGARMQALAEGRIDIALASHGLRLDDLARQGMAAKEIARTAVVFAVNASVPVVNLTDQEICDIYVERAAYSLVRKSFLVTRATPPPAVAQFLQFVRDPAGEKVIRANGAIPVR